MGQPPTKRKKYNMNNHHNYEHIFTAEQVDKIGSYLDEIRNYLDMCYPDANIYVKNPNADSPLEYMYINEEYIAIQYQDHILLELNRMQYYCEDSIYNHPNVCFELLLNWKEIKDKIHQEYERYIAENYEIDGFLLSFEV